MTCAGNGSRPDCRCRRGLMAAWYRIGVPSLLGLHLGSVERRRCLTSPGTCIRICKAKGNLRHASTWPWRSGMLPVAHLMRDLIGPVVSSYSLRATATHTFRVSRVDGSLFLVCKNRLRIRVSRGTHDGSSRSRVKQKTIIGYITILGGRTLRGV